MPFQYRQFPGEVRSTFTTRTGATAHVVFPLVGENTVVHDDGSHAPEKFTYIEHPPSPDAPYYVVECEHTPPDYLPRIAAVHVIAAHPGEREVRSGDLRTLSLHEAIEQAAQRAFRYPSVVGGPGPETLQPTSKTIAGLRRRARQRITPALLAEVASVYQENAHTGAPTKAVREHFHVSPATASKYVHQAREAGLDLPEWPTTTKDEGK